MSVLNTGDLGTIVVTAPGSSRTMHLATNIKRHTKQHLMYAPFAEKVFGFL